MILQGELDTTVPPSQAQALYDGLIEQGKWAQLELYPNSEHGFLMVREALEKKFGTKSVQVQESKLALEHSRYALQRRVGIDIQDSLLF